MTYLTGYNELDNLLDGIEKGRGYSISSFNPSLSRSLMINMMLNLSMMPYIALKKKAKTLFISFSNHSEKIEERVISILSGTYYSFNTKETLRKADKIKIELSKLERKTYDYLIESEVQSLDDIRKTIENGMIDVVFIDSIEDMMDRMSLKLSECASFINMLKEKMNVAVIYSTVSLFMDDSRKKRVKCTKGFDGLFDITDRFINLRNKSFNTHFEKRTETIEANVSNDGMNVLSAVFLEYDTTSERFIPSNLESEFIDNFLESNEYYIEEISRYMDVTLFYDFLSLSTKLDPNGMFYLSYNYSLNAYELDNETERRECMMLGLKWFTLAIERLNELKRNGEIERKTVDWSIFDTVLDSYVSTLSSLAYKKEFDSIYVKIRALLGENKNLGLELLKRSSSLTEYSKALYLVSMINGVFDEKINLNEMKKVFNEKPVFKNKRAKYSLVDYLNQLASFFYSEKDFETAVSCWMEALTIDEYDKTANYNLYLFYKQGMGIGRSSNEVRGYYERYLKALTI